MEPIEIFPRMCYTKYNIRRRVENEVPKKAKLIVIEGTDASGKQTQSELLYEFFKNENTKVVKLCFPDYESPSSALVKMYLNGDFGKTADSVDGKIASIFYAADRYASYKTKWEDVANDPDAVIIFDRYVTSNMIHQAVKVTDQKLLELSGGIVQGMSGSPIIQNGKLVGAVTHVLINDPTTGYGIFIENMLDQMGNLAE